MKRYLLTLGICLGTFVLTACNLCNDTNGPATPEGGADLFYNSFVEQEESVIFRCGADGTGHRPFRTTSGFIAERGAIFSPPQHGKVAFSATVGGRVFNTLVLANVDGSDARVLFQDTVKSIYYSILSPDARYVAWSRRGDDSFTNKLHIVDADGSHRTIADDIRVESAPVFSPDGYHVAYYSRNNEVIYMALDGSQRRVLATDAQNSGDYTLVMSFSQDGRKLVFMAAHPGVPGRSRIGLVDVATGQRADPAAIDATNIDMVPAISPDGSLLAFSRRRAGGSGAMLYVRDLTTGQERLLVDESRTYVNQIQWSPDGRRMAFSVVVGNDADNGETQVRTIDVASGRQTMVGSNMYFTFWAR